MNQASSAAPEPPGGISSRAPTRALRTYRIRLETLSPVFVGVGGKETLSPYTDFVQVGRELIYLDPRKLEGMLATRSELMDAFVAGVRTGMDPSGTRSEFDLAQFIRERLATQPEVLALRRVPVCGQIGRNQVERHIHNAGRPYIPGSSLKGAMRTAILYTWLLEHEEGQRFLTALADAVRQLWSAHGRYVSDSVPGWLVHKTREELQRFSEERLFGPLQSRDAAFRGPELRFLRISDTEPLPRELLRVERVSRFKLRDASLVSPQWSEVLPEHVETTFSLTIEPATVRPGLEFLNELSLDGLLRRLKRFAADNLEHELNVLDEHESVEALNEIYNVYVGLIEQSAPADACLLRVGRGKTYFDNSLGLALWQQDRELFQQFRKLLGLGQNPRTRKLVLGRFPTTRSYVAEHGEPALPLGWVKLTIVR
jgi:CRISPR-associated protein Csm5